MKLILALLIIVAAGCSNHPTAPKCVPTDAHLEWHADTAVFVLGRKCP